MAQTRTQEIKALYEIAMWLAPLTLQQQHDTIKAEIAALEAEAKGGTLTAAEDQRLTNLWHAENGIRMELYVLHNPD